MLVGLGCLLILLFVVGVGYNRIAGSEITETTSPVTQQTNDTAGTVSGGSQAGEKTTKKKDVPSETLLTALLSSGAALILAGILYARISSIKLPGGVEVGLSQEEKKATSEKVAEALPGADAQTVAEVTQAAAAHLRHAKTVGAATLPEEKIDEIVQQVTPDPQPEVAQDPVPEDPAEQ